MEMKTTEVAGEAIIIMTYILSMCEKFESVFI